MQEYNYFGMCIDINLKWLSSCSAVKEKEHIRVKLTCKAWKILDKLTVKILFEYNVYESCFQLTLCCWIACLIVPKKCLPA